MRVHLRKMLCYLGGVFVLVFHLWLHYVAIPLATLSTELGDAEGLTQPFSSSHSSSYSPSGEGHRLAATSELAAGNDSRHVDTPWSKGKKKKKKEDAEAVQVRRFRMPGRLDSFSSPSSSSASVSKSAAVVHWERQNHNNINNNHSAPLLPRRRVDDTQPPSRSDAHRRYPKKSPITIIPRQDNRHRLERTALNFDEVAAESGPSSLRRGEARSPSSSPPPPEETLYHGNHQDSAQYTLAEEKNNPTGNIAANRIGWSVARGLHARSSGKHTSANDVKEGEHILSRFGGRLPRRNNKMATQNFSADSGFLPGRDVGAPNRYGGKYMFNCSNIDQIAIKRTLGHGVTKQVYLGLYGDLKVAVKMVTRNVIDVTSCVKTLAESGTLSEQTRGRCFAFPNMKLMKEILLLEQLQHPNLLRMLGYCVRSEETESTSLQEHGVTAVYEYGLRFYLSTLSGWPYEARVRAAVELTDLLQYLAASPLGSLRVADFKDAHFLLKDGQVKLTDMDDVTSAEPTCLVSKKLTDAEQQTSLFISPSSSKDGRRVAPIRQQQGVCPYKLKCIGGVCLGYNAKHNLRKMNDLFFRNLLVLGVGDSHPGSAAQDAAYQILQLTRDLENLTIDAAHLKRRLLRLLDQENSTPGYS